MKTASDKHGCGSHLTIFGVASTYPDWLFFIRLFLEKTVVGLLCALLLNFMGLVPKADSYGSGRTVYEWVVVVVLLFPFLETFLFQLGIISLVRALRGNVWVQVSASAVPFALVHFLGSLASGICAGVVGGFYLGFAYVHWARTSSRKAFWLTTLLHSLSNLVLILPVIYYAR